MDEHDTKPEKTERCCSRAQGEHRRCRCHRVLAVIGLLAAGALIGAIAFHCHEFGGFRNGGGFRSHAGWHGPADAAAMSSHMQNGVERLLKKAEANDAQRVQGKALVSAATNDLDAMIKAHRATRDGFVSALSAPTIDRIQLEALRAKAMEQADTASKQAIKLAGDLAEVLTPTQRKRLAAELDLDHHP